MSAFFKAHSVKFAWGGLLVALGVLLQAIGNANGPAIIAAAIALVQALLPAVVNWLVPAPTPLPPAGSKSGSYWMALALLIGLSGSAMAQCPGGSCARPPASFVVRPSARVYAPRPVAPAIVPQYTTDPGGHLYRWVLYSDGFYRLVMIR